MFPLNLRSSLGAMFAAGTLLLVGCNSDAPDAVTPATTRMAIIVDPAYVDFDTTSAYHGASDMLIALRAAGYDPTPITVLDSANLAAVLPNTDLLIAPSEEVQSYTNSAPAARGLLSAWVNTGGHLVLLGDGTRDAYVLQYMFGAAVTTHCCLLETDTIPKVAQVAPFEGLGGSLLAIGSTSYLLASTLPEGSTPIFARGDTVVAGIIPYGTGRIAYLGWDFYDAKPAGHVDGGWLAFLPPLAGF